MRKKEGKITEREYNRNMKGKHEKDNKGEEDMRIKRGRQEKDNI